MLEVGCDAPEFCAVNQDDVEICFRDIKGRWIVLYFYPKDLTPGCTTQACDFTTAVPDFDDLDATILGVSPDDSAKHRKFIEKKELDITLLADTEKKMCEDYKVWQLKKFMGKEYMGVVRTTFIINPDGKIAAVWPKVKVKNHVNEVKSKLKELKAN